MLNIGSAAIVHGDEFDHARDDQWWSVQEKSSSHHTQPPSWSEDHSWFLAKNSLARCRFGHWRDSSQLEKNDEVLDSLSVNETVQDLQLF